MTTNISGILAIDHEAGTAKFTSDDTSKIILEVSGLGKLEEDMTRVVVVNSVATVVNRETPQEKAQAKVRELERKLAALKGEPPPTDATQPKAES